MTKALKKPKLVAAEPAAAATRPRLDIVIVGHVDHGKSTLVGRLLHDTRSLPEGKVEAIRAMCERRHMPFEWAFVMDAFQAERDQAVTIDSAHIWFHTKQRDYVIVDAPGHREFVKNMVSGAASCSAALLVIDAAEGMREQSRRHHDFRIRSIGARSHGSDNDVTILQFVAGTIQRFLMPQNCLGCIFDFG